MDEHQEIIQHQQSQELNKLAPQIPNPLKSDSSISFENDFGETPVGLGHFTLDQGWIAILTLAGAFVGAAFGGLPFAGVILLAGANDLRFAGKSSDEINPKLIEEVPEPTLPQAVEIPGQVVEDKQSPVAPEVSAQGNPKISDSISAQAGQEILDALVSTRRSTLLIGDTGAGKSVTQAYIVTKLFERQPNASVFVLSQKADSFCGLAQNGRVTLFDPNEPEQAVNLISTTWSVYDKRRRLPEAERPSLPPVRLLLSDWLSINQSLEELKNEEVVKSSRYLSKLADIIYNGRELNVCLMVDLQSYNLVAVGLKADRNSRKNFNLIGLGNYSVDEIGMVNESYGVLTNLISDHHIISDEAERTALTVTFKQLQPISKANQRPIIFSGLSPARLALLPDLRSYKNSVVPRKKSPVPEIAIESKTEAIALTTPQSEFKISDTLGEPLRSIWLACKDKEDWMTVRELQQKSLTVLKGKSAKNLKQYFGLLADSGFGDIDEMDGDKPKSDSSVGFKAY
jgi:hypothetical protein